MRSTWRVFTDTTSAEKALKRIEKLTAEFSQRAVDVAAAPYHKGGFIVSFHIEHSFDSWAEAVLEIVTLVQLRGRRLELSAFVQEELDIFAECSIPGITHIHCHCTRDEAT